MTADPHSIDLSVFVAEHLERGRARCVALRWGIAIQLQNLFAIGNLSVIALARVS
jgi:hypothetical protein